MDTRPSSFRAQVRARPLYRAESLASINALRWPTEPALKSFRHHDRLLARERLKQLWSGHLP